MEKTKKKEKLAEIEEDPKDDWEDADDSEAIENEDDSEEITPKKPDLDSQPSSLMGIQSQASQQQMGVSDFISVSQFAIVNEIYGREVMTTHPIQNMRRLVEPQQSQKTIETICIKTNPCRGVYDSKSHENFLSQYNECVHQLKEGEHCRVKLAMYSNFCARGELISVLISPEIKQTQCPVCKKFFTAKLLVDAVTQACHYSCLQYVYQLTAKSEKQQQTHLSKKIGKQLKCKCGDSFRGVDRVIKLKAHQKACTIYQKKQLSKKTQKNDYYFKKNFILHL